jgi:hypothetical protein
MKLKDLRPILYSATGEIQWAIVYDLEKNEDLEYGCSIEFAVTHYGGCEVKRISSCYNFENETDYLVITI